MGTRYAMMYWGQHTQHPATACIWIGKAEDADIDNIKNPDYDNYYGTLEELKAWGKEKVEAGNAGCGSNALYQLQRGESMLAELDWMTGNEA